MANSISEALAEGDALRSAELQAAWDLLSTPGAIVTFGDLQRATRGWRPSSTSEAKAESMLDKLLGHHEHVRSLRAILRSRYGDHPIQELIDRLVDEWRASSLPIEALESLRIDALVVGLRKRPKPLWEEFPDNFASSPEGDKTTSSASSPEGQKRRSKTRRKKGDGENSSARELLIAAFTAHHRDKDGYTLYEPIAGRELARRAGVAAGSFSKFFEKYFDDHKTYVSICRNRSPKLETELRTMNRETITGPNGLHYDIPDE